MSDGAPGRELIIGSAVGNEILASLYFGSQDIEAVELNPVTVSLLEDYFADYTGHLTERPEVKPHQGDGRSEEPPARCSRRRRSRAPTPDDPSESVG